MFSFTRLLQLGYVGILTCGVLLVVPVSNSNAQFRNNGLPPVQPGPGSIRGSSAINGTSGNLGNLFGGIGVTGLGI